jgi:hypothetical protein
MRADLAGNTLLTARSLVAPLSSSPQSFVDSVSHSDATDLYQLRMGQAGQVSLQLSQLSGDVDLQLLDRNGSKISGSYNAGNQSESLKINLAAGDYFIHVAQFQGESDYTLQITDGSTPPPIVVPEPIVPPPPIVIPDPIVPPTTNPPVRPGFAQKAATGNIEIDALINEAGYYWDTSQNGGVITYSFYRASAGAYYGEERVSEVNEAIKTSVRSILQNLETYVNLRFVEVAETANQWGALRYMFSNGGDNGGNYYAYAYYPWMNDIGGDVHLNPNWDNTYASFSRGPGTDGYTTLIHETLHALGLKHPGNYDAQSNVGEGPFLPTHLDHKSNTVMSYNATGQASITPLRYDLQALQYLYGARSRATGDSVYQFTAPMNYQLGDQAFGNPNQAVNQIIWDTAGRDTIDLSNSGATYNYHVDLRAGLITNQTALTAGVYTHYSSGESFVAPSYGTYLGIGVVIEAVVSSLGNDRIIANQAANRFSGYGSGNFGQDQLAQTDAADVLDLSGNQRSQLTIQSVAGSLQIDWNNGSRITVTDYFKTAQTLKILIEGQYYSVTANGSWLISSAPIAAAAPALQDTHLMTGAADAINRTVPRDRPSPIASSTLPRCHCVVCTGANAAMPSTPIGLNLIGQTDLAAALRR